MSRRIPGALFLRNLIERRSLLLQLVRRDFNQRYVGSAAGWLWGVIHPIVLLASYYFVFGVCLKNPTENYPLVLICGMLPWLLFSETVTRSSSSLVEHANLITKTVFPAEIVPLAIFLVLFTESPDRSFSGAGGYRRSTWDTSEPEHPGASAGIYVVAGICLPWGLAGSPPVCRSTLTRHGTVR